jgi:protein tyrosine phosphatase
VLFGLVSWNFLFFSNCQKLFKQILFLKKSIEDNDAISLELFETYVKQMHVDGDFGFAQLYEEITATTKSFNFSSDISLHESNRCKNRYSNILTCKSFYI